MKRKRNISLKTLVWSAVLTGTGVLCVAAMQHKSNGAIREAKVQIHSEEEGNHLLTGADILAELEDILGPVNQIPVAGLNLHELEDILYYNPFVKDVNVFISGDNVLHVHIDERQPVLRIFDHAGESFYLDNGGIQIPVSPHYTARVAVANGHIPPFDPDLAIQEQTVFYEIFSLISAIHQDKFLRALIEQIYVEAENTYVLIPKIGNEKIRFGDSARMEEKLENLKIFYTHAMPQQGWGLYQEINLEYKDQVVCKKRKKTS